MLALTARFRFEVYNGFLGVAQEKLLPGSKEKGITKRSLDRLYQIYWSGTNVVEVNNES